MNRYVVGVAGLALSCLVGLSCGGPSGEKGDPSGSNASSSTPPSASALPRSTDKPAKTLPKIRDNSATGEPVALAPLRERVAIESRLAVSKIVPTDPLTLLVRTSPEEKLDHTHAAYKVMLTAEDLVKSMVFEIKRPDGSTVMLTPGAGTPAPPASNVLLAALNLHLDLTAEAVSLGPTKHPWEKAPADLFAAPGSYSVSLRIKVKPGEAELTLSSKPLTFEVAVASDANKSIADLSEMARSLVKDKAQLSKLPELATLVIDDVDGARSFSFFVREETRHDYDARVFQILLDPSGKEIHTDEFTHFTCIAAGTPIETTRGPVPVESVVPGMDVVSYDVGAGRFTESKVVSTSSSYADKTLRFGALRVTSTHPIYADGQWLVAGDLTNTSTLLELDGTRVSDLPRLIEGPSTVYDLSVTSPHTFFAGGLLVHNKAAHVPLGGNQPWNGWFFRRSAAP